MKSKSIVIPLLGAVIGFFPASHAWAAPYVHATGMFGAVAGGMATSVLTLQPGYDLIGLDLTMDYDASVLSLSEADVTVDYGNASYSLADFVNLLDGYNGSNFATAGAFLSPGHLDFAFLSAVVALPSPASMTFTSSFQVLASLLPGTVTTVSYSGTTAYDSSDPSYMGDPFMVDAQISAAAVPEPQSGALALAGLTALAALRRRRQ